MTDSQLLLIIALINALLATASLALAFAMSGMRSDLQVLRLRVLALEYQWHETAFANPVTVSPINVTGFANSTDASKVQTGKPTTGGMRT